MQEDLPQGALALDILEHSPSVALRVAGKPRRRMALFATSNIAMYGYTREQFLNGEVSWSSLIHPENLDAVCRTAEEYEARGVDQYTLTYRIAKPGGQEVWVNDFTTVCRNENGERLYSDCILFDSSETVRSRQKIKDNLRQQRVLNDILQGLHNADSDEAFRIILETTGKYLDISRVLLFEDTLGHAACRLVQQ